MKSVRNKKALIYITLLFILTVILFVFAIILVLSGEIVFPLNGKDIRYNLVFILPLIPLTIAHYKIISIEIDEKNILIKRFFSSRPKIYVINDIREIKCLSPWFTTLNHEGLKIIFNNGTYRSIDSFYFKNYVKLIYEIKRLHTENINQSK